MTPAQINAAIATWMGWTHLERSGILIPDPPFRGYPPSGAIVGKKQEIPNFHGDLNACQEPIKKLDEDQFEKFIDNLQDGIGTMRNIFMATPPQRAKALLRTLNLWKE